MIKLRSLFSPIFVILAIIGLVNSYYLKPVNQAGANQIEYGKSQVFDDLLDEKVDRKGEHMEKEKDICELYRITYKTEDIKDFFQVICKNCTIIIASASNGSSAGNRLSIGNGLPSTGLNGSPATKIVGANTDGGRLATASTNKVAPIEAVLPSIALETASNGLEFISNVLGLNGTSANTNGSRSSYNGERSNGRIEIPIPISDNTLVDIDIR